MGTFTFTATDLSVFDVRESKPITGGSITRVDTDYTIDCLAEYTVKVRGYASLPSRKPAHIITPFRTLCAGIITSYSVMKIIKLIEVPNSKNTILLKLRI
ncbi:MAG: hypothetical protein LBD93_08800 [Treponema sp.]|nr:hypothetical protein [Treponema sp.]